jgi:hypothetical protein
MLIRDFLTATKYNIGFIENKLEDIISNKAIQVNWLKHSYKDRWFADPFILDVTEKHYIVLVEEWYDPIGRGRISKLIVNRNDFTLRAIKTILELESHLSFPFIQRTEDAIYIIPENSATGRLPRYKYNPITDEVCFDSIICHDRLTDSVLFEFNGAEMMFSTKLPDANGKELGIYKKNDDDTYSLYDTYHFEENLSRMAGNIFTCHGKLYRPAQVCIKSYGDAVSLQEVLFNNGKFQFKEVRRLYSPSPKYDLGFHTFNVFNDSIVVDGLGYRKYIISNIFKKLWHIIKIK